MSSSDEDASDLPRQSDRDELKRRTFLVMKSSVLTDEVEQGGVTSTTNDLDSGNSLPDSQAQNNLNFSGVVMEEEAEYTHNALKDQPADKERARQSSAEDSEDPLSVPSRKKFKKSKAETKKTLEEPANSKVDYNEREEALLERVDEIIDGMKSMFEALEALKTDHKILKKCI